MGPMKITIPSLEPLGNSQSFVKLVRVLNIGLECSLPCAVAVRTLWHAIEFAQNDEEDQINNDLKVLQTDGC